MTTPKWKIYYGDGSTFDSTDGMPGDAPCDNVQVIVSYDEQIGRVCSHRWDWYYYADGQWYGSDVFGLLDQITSNIARIEAVKQGRTISSKKYKEIVETALSDPLMPKTNDANDWLIENDIKPKQQW